MHFRIIEHECSSVNITSSRINFKFFPVKSHRRVNAPSNNSHVTKRLIFPGDETGQELVLTPDPGCLRQKPLLVCVKLRSYFPDSVCRRILFSINPLRGHVSVVLRGQMQRRIREEEVAKQNTNLVGLGKAQIFINSYTIIKFSLTCV